MHAPIRRSDLLSALVILAALTVALAPRVSDLRARAGGLLSPRGGIARLVIPSIAVESTVVEVSRTTRGGSSEWAVAPYAVGHHAGSGTPGGGTNVVLSGHNNVKGEVFRRLDELRRGDHVSVYTSDGVEHRYRVTRSLIVREEGAPIGQRRTNARHMRPTERERLTLISCWPYEPAPPFRIIVVAEPAESKASTAD